MSGCGSLPDTPPAGDFVLVLVVLVGELVYVQIVLIVLQVEAVLALAGHEGGHHYSLHGSHHAFLGQLSLTTFLGNFPG